MVDLKKIKEKLKEYEYVSFDIFDTLIKRDVDKPTDIFKIVELELENKLDVQINDFFYKRLEAEKKARKYSSNLEISLDDIYDMFDDKDIIENMLEIKNIEIAIELNMCTRNEEMYLLFQWCLNSGKHIIITSDMYLSKEVIEKILTKNGYNGYEKIFLSNEYQDRKANNGYLFKKACDELNIYPSNLCHIGDSFKSDVYMAKKVGCNAIYVKKYKNKKDFFYNSKLNEKDNFYYNILQSFCNNRSYYLDDWYHCFGYKSFGPLLMGFSKWLINSLKEHNIKKIYFLSRDGLIMKKAFDLLNDNSEIKSYYLEVSRRSVRVPQIFINPEYENVIETFSAASMQSISIFFDNLGLEYEKYISLCESIGISKDYTFKKSEMKKNIKLRKLYESIKQDVISNSKNEYKALLKYMESMDFDGDVAIVDIGWRGSMQKFLHQICEYSKIPVSLTGFYIGLSSGAAEYSKKLPLEFYGYLFDCNKNKNEKDIRSPFVGLIETFFSAQLGSCKKYSFDKRNNVIISYYENEYLFENELTEDGKKVVLIQEGALKFIFDIKESIIYKLNISKKVVFKNILKVGVFPNREESIKFGDISFFDGELLKLAQPKSLFQYIKNPKIFVIDFYNSRWKIGFLKRTFKVFLPYERIYWFLSFIKR